MKAILIWVIAKLHKLLLETPGAATPARWADRALGVLER